MRYNVDDILSRFRSSYERPSALRGTGESGGRPVLDADDFFLSGIRGVESAVQDVWGLADTLTGDLLPDYEERFFGESNSTVGGLLEGVANFTVGFLPVAGWLSKGAKIGKGIQLARGLSKAAQAGAKARGAIAAAQGIGIGRGLVAGAITDFAVFDGHEARLSDLIQTFPALENPITDYLASDPDDPELLGRFKTSIEGLGLGGMFDALSGVLRITQVGRVARAQGIPAKEALKQAEAIEGGLRGRVTSLFGGVPSPRRASDIPADEIRKVADEVVDSGKTIGSKKVNPRSLSDAQLEAEGIKHNYINLERMADPEIKGRAIRFYEDVAEEVIKRNGLPEGRTLEEATALAASEVADVVGADDPVSILYAAAAASGADVDDLARIGPRTLAWRDLTAFGSKTITEQVGKILSPGGDSTAELAKFLRLEEGFYKLTANTRALSSEKGRILREQRIQANPDIDIGDATKTLDETKAPDLDPEFEKAVDQDQNLTDAELVSRAGGAARVKDRARAALTAFEESGTAGLASVARAHQGSKGIGMILEYFMNSILSGPRTAAVNGLSGALVSLWRPTELLMGAALSGTFQSASRKQMRSIMVDATREITGLTYGFSETMRMAGRTLKTGENRLLPLSRVDDTRPRNAITAEAFGLDATTASGKAVDIIGNIIRFPSTFLAASDEVIKQSNYRSRVRSGLLRQAGEAGMTSEETAEYVARMMDKLVRDGQAFTTDALLREGRLAAAEAGAKGERKIAEFARKYAQKKFAEVGPELSKIARDGMAQANEVAFTTPLKDGSIPKRLSDAVNAHPYLRLALPFIRTPTNILRFAHERTTGAAIGSAQLLLSHAIPKQFRNLSRSQNRLVRDMLSGDPRRKAEAMGRVSMGVGLATWATLKASEGTITGAGPADPEQRQIMEAEGWLPYSVLHNGRYYQYGRLDPASTILGLAADIVEYSKYTAGDDEPALAQLMWGLASGVAEQFTNKSYLTGIRQLVEVLDSPKEKAPTYLRKLGANIVPNLLAQGVYTAGDEYTREVRSFFDALAAKVPGYSSTLAPHRNVLGEPIRRIEHGLGSETLRRSMDWFVPLAFRTTSDDFVTRELASLEYGFTPPKPEKNGLDLHTFEKGGQTAYDRWGELTGSVVIQRKRLKSALTALFRSRDYQRLPAESSDEFNSPRIEAVNRVIRQYRSKAWDQTLREYPELARENQTNNRVRADLRRGVDRRQLL